MADVREEMLDHEIYVGMESANPQWLSVSRFKRTMAVSDAELDASLPRIAMELRKGRRDMLRAVLEAAERLDGYSYKGKAAAAPHAPPAPAVPASAPLGQAIENFMGEHSPQWSAEMQDKARAYLAVVVEHFGSDRPMAGISRQDAAELKKLVQALPANRKTRPETRDLTLQQAIALPGVRNISAKTVNSYIDTFRRFWDWAERHGHSPHKLFDGMTVAKAKHADEGRKAYRQDQSGRLHAELTGNAAGLVKKDDHKWGVLLGLYTGARLREIAQLGRRSAPVRLSPTARAPAP